MKKVMLSMLIALSAFSLVTADADAKRLGGGGSFGRQSSNVTQKAAPAPAPSNPPRGARHRQQRRRRLPFHRSRPALGAAFWVARFSASAWAH